MLWNRARALYRKHFRNARRERQFVASCSFFLTFALARTLTNLFRTSEGAFEGVHIGQTHVHHLVLGIFMLLAVGYGWLLQVGTGELGPLPHAHSAAAVPTREELRGAITASRLMAMLYGIGAALTLDEFALWLHLEDVYWAREGRASIDAVFLFGGVVSIGLWGGPFLGALARQVAHLSRRR